MSMKSLRLSGPRRQGRRRPQRPALILCDPCMPLAMTVAIALPQIDSTLLEDMLTWPASILKHSLSAALYILAFWL